MYLRQNQGKQKKNFSKDKHRELNKFLKIEIVKLKYKFKNRVLF